MTTQSEKKMIQQFCFIDTSGLLEMKLAVSFKQHNKKQNISKKEEPVHYHSDTVKYY